MRDLQAHGQLPETNGHGPSVLDLTPEDGPSPEVLASLASQRRVVKRDQRLSEMAVLLIDTAKMLEPVISLIGSRVLRWTTLGAAVWLASYAIMHAANSWERAAIAGGFLLLSPLLWWRA